MPEARSVATRIWSAIRELYLRLGSQIMRALGRTESADQFALDYFHERLKRMLAGELPENFIRAAGGPRTSMTELAEALGLRPRGMAHGFDFAEPTSPAAVAFNMDQARWAKQQITWDQVKAGEENGDLFYKVKRFMPADPVAPTALTTARSTFKRKPNLAARLIYNVINMSWPRVVNAPLLGEKVRLIYPEGKKPQFEDAPGARPLDSFELRIFHWMGDEATKGAPRVPDLDKASAIPNIRDTVENASVLFKQNDNTLGLARKYNNGRIHVVMLATSPGGEVYVNTQFWMSAVQTLHDARILKKKISPADADDEARTEGPSGPRPGQRSLKGQNQQGPDEGQAHRRARRAARPQEPVGDRENASNAAHINLSVLNDTIEVDGDIAAAIQDSEAVETARRAGLSVRDFFRRTFGLADSDTLKEQVA